MKKLSVKSKNRCGAKKGTAKKRKQALETQGQNSQQGPVVTLESVSTTLPDRSLTQTYGQKQLWPT